MSKPTEKCNHDKNFVCSLCSSEIPPSSTMGLAPSAPSGEEEAQAYADRMDFVNWFERTTGLPFEDMGTFHHDEIAKWIAQWTAHILQQQREQDAQIAEGEIHGTRGSLNSYDARTVASRIAAAIRSQQ